MEYVFLLVDDESSWNAMSEQQQQENMEAHIAFNTQLAEAGVLRGGKALQPSSTATTVRTVDGGDRIISDGPYAEAKEHLGGYYEVDVADLDAALHWARQLPMLPGGLVEVRPILPMDGD